MKKLILLLIFICTTGNAQVNQSETEKIQSIREQNRKEDALINETSKANEISKITSHENFQTESDLQLEIDHSSLGYTVLSDSKNPVSGIKFSGAFCAQFLQEQKIDKRYLLAGGVELPIDLELPTQRIIPYGGGGLQIGISSGIYFSGGLDFRITKWFKFQWGAHYPLGKELQNQFAAGLTW